MNRTHLIVVSAAVLAAAALIAGRSHPTAPTAPPAPVAVAAAVPVKLPAAVATGTLLFQSRLSSGRVVAGPSQVYAKLDVSAPMQLESKSQRLPVNLAVVIDHSCSMAGAKMEQAKAAAVAMVDQLKDGDRLALVAFSDDAQVNASTVVSTASKAELRRFIDRIDASGGTNISEGLDRAYIAVRPFTSDYKVSRVVLLSDGQPSAGDVRPEQLARRAESMRAVAISTSAFGIGLDFNGPLMNGIANAGGGGYAFIEDAAKLPLAFADELSAASATVARAVKVHVQPATGVTVSDVPGHTFTRSGTGIDVPLYDFGPGQSAQLLLRLDVNAPADGSVLLADANVSFIDVKEDRPAIESLQLTAAVGDARQVVAAEDHDVVEMARRVDLSQRVVEAKQAYERGDSKLAFSLMGNVRSLFGASADALAGEDELEGNWRRGGDYANRANLSLTKKTMKNFGLNNTSQY